MARFSSSFFFCRATLHAPNHTGLVLIQFLTVFLISYILRIGCMKDRTLCWKVRGTFTKPVFAIHRGSLHGELSECCCYAV